MRKLPSKYAWLSKEGAPKMLAEALRHYGTLEHVGKGSNVNIMAWAKEVGVIGWYPDDDVPWCGLFVAVVCKRCNYPHPNWANVLGARYWGDGPKGAWKGYGRKIPFAQASLWDILVFTRPGGAHVGFYVGENDHAYLVYGGNQSNAVGFVFIAKSRLTDVRRPDYKIGVPGNIRKIYLSETGELSTNEA